jgi:integrase/recombinase XerD
MTPTPPLPLMPNHHPENERMKRKYMIFMREADGYDEATMDAALAAIHRFEAHTNVKDFKTFRHEQAVSFKHHLEKQTNVRTGKLLAKSTLLSILSDLKAFFFWLADQRGYKGRFQYSDSKYFNLSDRDTRIARARPEKKVPSLEQMQHVIRSMPYGTVIERRDRALVAFILLSAGRNGAVIGLKMRHVDIAGRRVTWDPRDVQVKRGKTFVTDFYPVGDDIRQFLDDWVSYLTNELLWGPDDPLFPSTLQEIGPDGNFQHIALERKCWATADPVREIFKAAFAAVGLPYCSPHRVRDTISMLGQKICPSFEAWKAWSQGMGHEDISTTWGSYGPVSADRQAEIMRSFGQAQAKPNDVVADLRALLLKHESGVED